MSLPHFQDVPLQCNKRSTGTSSHFRKNLLQRIQGYGYIRHRERGAILMCPLTRLFPRARPHNKNLSESQDKGNN